jgi:hypothetical protein
MGSPQGKFEKPTGGFYNSKSESLATVSKSKPTVQVAKKSPQGKFEKPTGGFYNSVSESKSTAQVAKKSPNKKF